MRPECLLTFCGRHHQLTFELLPVRQTEFGFNPFQLNDAFAGRQTTVHSEARHSSWSSSFQQQQQQQLNDKVKVNDEPNQICCPIWSYAMDQLDASQEQPRDQTPFTHLISAPAAQGYLLAKPAGTQNNASSLEAANQPQLLVSDSDGCQTDLSPVLVEPHLELLDAVNGESSSSNDSQQPPLMNGGPARRRRFRRSSNESVENQRSKQLTATGSVKRRQSKKSAKMEPLSRSDNNNNAEFNDWQRQTSHAEQQQQALR